MRIISLSPLLLFFVLAVLVIRTGRMGWFAAIVLMLFGFFLASSMFASLVSEIVSDLVGASGGGH
jgi:hypothetical protein